MTTIPVWPPQRLHTPAPVPHHGGWAVRCGQPGCRFCLDWWVHENQMRVEHHLDPDPDYGKRRVPHW